MSVYRVSASADVYQESSHQASSVQLRNVSRCLLQSIKDGNLAEAQQAYDIITKTFPDIFQTLSRQLTYDFKAIGYALEKGDISGSKQAVVKLQDDLQNIGRAGNQDRREANIVGARTHAAPPNNLFCLYNDDIHCQPIGTNIDIMI